MPKDDFISTQAAVQASRAARELAEPKFLQIRKDMRAGKLHKLQMQLANGFGRWSPWLPLGDEAQTKKGGAHVATQSNLYLALVAAKAWVGYDKLGWKDWAGQKLSLTIEHFLMIESNTQRDKDSHYGTSDYVRSVMNVLFGQAPRFRHWVNGKWVYVQLDYTWAKFPDAVNARVVTLEELKEKWHISEDYAALIKLQCEECKKR